MLKIVLTGGPCAGKSEALSKLTQELEERSYKVFTVDEAATRLILNGIKPCANISMEEFQEYVLKEQLASEDLFNSAVKNYNEDKVVVFYDRGIMDSCAYVDKETTFRQILSDNGMTFSDVYARYDAVLHLVTAANGAEKYYQWNDPTKKSTGNNAARRESPEEARQKDVLTLNAWVGHPHLRVFDNSTDFGGKIKRIVAEVFALLGEPEPREIERKFLIKKPTEDEIKALGCVSKTNIVQTYLTCDYNETERRVRQRGDDINGYTFYYTEKRNIAPGVRVEEERKISADEYVKYLGEADIIYHQIRKSRYCFMFDNRYFEMDIYPFSDKYAIVEIELNDINEQFEKPPLTFIADVTNDVRYRNHYLAQSLAFPVRDTEWIYEVGRETSEILGSGSTYSFVKRTCDEQEAKCLLKECGRNYIIRTRIADGKTSREYFDFNTNQFVTY